MLMKNTFLICALIVIAFTFSCSSYNNEIKYGSFIYEGQTYKTVKIGEQNWMAENLNYAVTGSKCGTTAGETLTDENTINCDLYGRLYNWTKAVCPSGWHIPSYDEWNTLVSYVESDNKCSDCAGKYLKATSGWNNRGNGNDKYGFAALPGGSSNFSDGSLYNAGNYFAIWWSTTEFDFRGAYNFSMDCRDERVTWSTGEKTSWFSVRCLQD
ncbi:MAG: hypothetical protein LBC75_13185 [Fibromonadaceae bacterium]|nr:hypothetical protein [Fibromonadaceae bacterium]